MSYDFLPCLACGSMNHYLDDCDDEGALTRYYAEDDDYPLHNADPKCEHTIVLLGSGYKCGKCSGWFCL